MDLTDLDLEHLVAYWNAANYLTVAQIYLQENVLLREPLRPEHIKPRLLGHWGTSPGLNLVYAQANRLIRESGAEAILITGPGHGGPAILANVYLEGTYSEIYPEVSQDEAGMRRLVRQFSTPGGVPSHVSVPTPGSIHEGGELGYALVHALGAVFDNPDLLALCVIGDGEAETGPLEGSWKGVQFLNPVRDGAVLPILHLNEYKISGPTVLGRAPEARISSLLKGHGYRPLFVSGTDPHRVHRALWAALTSSYARIRHIQACARTVGLDPSPGWPAIVLRTPKGWTGPRTVDGVRVEGSWRAHQVPLGQVRERPEHLAQLEAWLRSYHPETLFDDVDVAPDGRVMEVLSEHSCQGWLEGYLLTGRHGMLATYEAFAMVPASMAIQHTKWLEAAAALEWRAPIASLNYLLTSTCWRNDHNGFSHQGPGLIDTMISMSGSVVRVYLPPDANCLLSIADHCLRSRNHVNLIVIDKQPQLQYLGMDAAREHCARGAGVWEWAGTEGEADAPDVIIACAGDIPTQEALAAAALLRRLTPELVVRFVNVVDLMALPPPDVHPHGLPDAAFVELFTHDTEVVMAFHGYARAMHQILHGRPHAGRFHVRGYMEHGTTTTPFDMVVLNLMSRYHLALEAVRRSHRRMEGTAELEAHCRNMLQRHHDHVRSHFEDMPEVRDWVWTG